MSDGGWGGVLVDLFISVVVVVDAQISPIAAATMLDKDF